MVAKICSDGTSSRPAAGEIHPALSKLRHQLQSGGRHGAPLHRETKRHRSRETLERIWQTAVLATATERIARKVTCQATRRATKRSSSRLHLLWSSSYSLHSL